MAKDGRANPNCGVIEKASLNEVRKDLGITANTHAEHLASNSNKKRSAPPAEEIYDTWDDSDDDVVVENPTVPV